MRCWAGKVAFLSLVLRSPLLVLFFLLTGMLFVRVGVLMAAVRPGMGSAWPCGVTVRFGLISATNI